MLWPSEGLISKFTVFIAIHSLGSRPHFRFDSVSVDKGERLRHELSCGLGKALLCFLILHKSKNEQLVERGGGGVGHI